MSLDPLPRGWLPPFTEFLHSTDVVSGSQVLLQTVSIDNTIGYWRDWENIFNTLDLPYNGDGDRVCDNGDGDHACGETAMAAVKSRAVCVISDKYSQEVHEQLFESEDDAAPNSRKPASLRVLFR